MGVKLTKRAVDAAAPKERRYFVWDSELKGFGLVVHPSGEKSYCFRYRTQAGRDRRPRIAGGDIPPDLARKEAQKMKALVIQGIDPLADRQARRGALTVADLGLLYMEQHGSLKKSGAEDQRKIEKDINPRLGRRTVERISQEDIASLKNAMRERPVSFNRLRALLSKMFALAEREGWRPLGSNPCQHIPKYSEKGRDRFLSVAERRRFGEALAILELKQPQRASAVNALRLIALTGARRNEVLGLRWGWFDSERQCFDLPDSKTGPMTLRLSSDAMGVLRVLGMKREGWVFPSSRGDGPLRDVRKTLDKACEIGEIKPFRLHDLRHTKASAAIASGLTLRQTGDLLRHASLSSTQRYTHLEDAHIREAEEAVQGGLAEDLGLRRVQ